jgi:glycosyltransferase involved in cell wall biosynthesis
MSQINLSNKRIAVLHYWLVTWRGGEKVVRSILDLFPNADVYTLFYEPSVCGPHLVGHEVYSSVLNKPFLRKQYQKIFPLYPTGVRSLTIQGDYDLIISSESGPIKGVHNPNNIPHLCYIHTPMRYCWGFTQDYLNTLPKITRPFAKVAFETLRRYDETTVSGVNKFVANSQNVRARVKTYYDREASVVFPPIALDLFNENLVATQCSERGYYLSFGAITPYKGVGLLVDAFNKNGMPLVVIGEGSERKKLEAVAKSNIKFVGSLPYSKIKEYILGAKALLFPGEEDFGMIPLEVMAMGVPVLAYNKGGALETVVENLTNVPESTGMFFSEQGTDVLQNAIETFEKVQNDFDPTFIRAHARLFGEDHFKVNMSAEIEDLLNNPTTKTN